MLDSCFEACDAVIAACCLPCGQDGENLTTAKCEKSPSPALSLKQRTCCSIGAGTVPNLVPA